jgi:hypothetical protein
MTTILTTISEARSPLELKVTVKLTIGTGKGTSQTIDLDAAGGTMRFGVGFRGSALSEVWNVWSNRSGGDVYVAARSLAGLLKVSLHESGNWRLQWTRPEIAAKYAPGRPRLVDQWDRPQEIGVGWTHALKIAVPEEDFVVYPYPEDRTRPIAWVPPLRPDHGVSFHVFVARPNQGTLNLRGFFPLIGYTLGNGEVCLVAAAALKLPTEVDQELAEQRRIFREELRRRGVAPAPSIRAGRYGTTDDGIRTIWDLALFPNHSEDTPTADCDLSSC